MKVSIVIPIYNEEENIKPLIEEIFSVNPNYEIICIDDGSTDNTLDILSLYKNDIIAVNQDNKGVSGARNRGIALSSGKFIAFLDSDDFWMPNKLSVQVDFFNTNHDALICQTDEIWIRNNIRVNPKKRHKKLSGMIFEPSLNLCLVSPSSGNRLKRELFKTVGLFDENLPACEDYDLWLRISCIYPVYLIDIPLIIKRGGHNDQLSGMSGLDKYRIIALNKMITSGLLSKNQYRAVVRTLKEKCSIYANGCLKRGNIDKALFYKTMGDTWGMSS